MRFFVFATLILFQAAGVLEADVKTYVPCEADLAEIPQERFFIPLRKIEAFFLRDFSSDDEMLEAVLKEDLRYQLFQLEGLFRVYRKSYGKNFELPKINAKALEDAIGKFDEVDEYLKAAKKHGADKKVLDLLEQKRERAKAALLSVIRFSQWQSRKVLRALVYFVEFVAWPKIQEDQERVAESLGRELRKIKDDFNAGVYDPAKLQLGIHELRRDLRWFLIYFQALRGVVVLNLEAIQEKPWDEFSKAFDPDSRFSQIPSDPRIKNPVVLPAAYYEALSQYVSAMGDLKDIGEEIEAIAHAAYESGFVKSYEEAFAYAERIYGKSIDEDVYPNAHRLFKDLKDLKLLEALASRFP